MQGKEINEGIVMESIAVQILLFNTMYTLSVHNTILISGDCRL